MSAANIPPFERLAAIATLGTRRAPLPKESPWPDESLAAAGADPVARETCLLRAAAAGVVWERAGVRAAPTAEAAVQDFPPRESARWLDESAGWRLARIVGGEHPYLLNDWFEAAATTGRVLPPHWVPLVLDNVAPEARAPYATVLGPAAAWLAARNSRWLVAAADVDVADARWQEGSLDERRVLLAAIRKTDRARSLAWLRSTWETDAPEAREAFLAILAIDVAADDEEFLESALDDKRKPVRLAAADLLARLPDSALARRVIARLDPLIELESQHAGMLGRLRRRKLRVDLPTAPDKASVRDGIELKPPASKKIGERAFWLSQLVAMVSPAHWCRRFDCDAETFIDAVLATDHANELLGALTDATLRHPAREWLLAVARAWMTSKQDFPVVTQAIIDLANAAPPAERSALIEQQLREVTPANQGYIVHVLDVVELRWNATITKLALDQLAELIAGTKDTWSQSRNRLDAWARRCDLALGAQRAAALLEKCGEDHSWRNALEQFNDIVAFRAAMHKELSL
jgi:hypothetical protein